MQCITDAIGIRANITASFLLLDCGAIKKAKLFVKIITFVELHVSQTRSVPPVNKKKRRFNDTVTWLTHPQKHRFRYIRDMRESYIYIVLFSHPSESIYLGNVYAIWTCWNCTHTFEWCLYCKTCIIYNRILRLIFNSHEFMRKGTIINFNCLLNAFTFFVFNEQVFRTNSTARIRGFREKNVNITHNNYAMLLIVH